MAASTKKQTTSSAPKASEILKGLETKHWRVFLKHAKKFASFPELLWMQEKWFNEFINLYMHKLFEEINPIRDIAGEKHSLEIDEIKISDPIESIETCKKKEMTYGGILSGRIKLTDTESGKVLFNKRANIGILPLMTQWGSYIINGVERVVISQLVRSYGIFFSFDKKDFTYSFKLIPEKGPWLQVIIEKSGNVVARINKSRKFSVVGLLRIFGYETDDSIRALFDWSFDKDEGDYNYIEHALKKDTSHDAESAAIQIYGKMRPGEIIDADSAIDYIKSQFLSPDRILMGNVARRKINAKLSMNKPLDKKASHVFDADDLVESLKYLLAIANDKKGYYVDDIDHLSNRRIRSMGEILYSHLQPVVRKFVKSVKGKLSILNTEELIKLTDLVNFKIIDNAMKSFFATSQLSQFLDQINPLAEIEHKRRLTSLGPGWLKRETAKFEVRDVHPSHYGRICPIETPEGQNIGLVVYQSIFSQVNAEWFLETPAVEVRKSADAHDPKLGIRIAEWDIVHPKTKKVLAKDNEYIGEAAAKEIAKAFDKGSAIPTRPYLSEKIEYISPERDEKFIIADVSTQLDEHKNITQKRVAARHFMDMEMFYVNDITHMDVNSSQIFSPNTSLIPFIDHDEAVRAGMATNMQRQAVPLLNNDAPLVGTGLEADVAAMTYAVIAADDEGEVIYVDGKRVKVKYKKGIKEYSLINFKRSNQKSIINQRAKVSIGQKVKKGDVLWEGPSIENGEIALGKNLRVAFMPWEWYNFEDSMIISQKLVKDDTLTSIHIEEYEIEVADTKLGPEETTNDIPWVSLAKLKNLDEEGIIRIGSTVKGGDILVGKITPKSEGELSPEEKLIQAIFGDKSKSLKDTSLYLPSGSEGKVIDVLILDAKKWDNLMAGIRKKIKVYVAMTRKIEVWDKLAGRHGNKGIIAHIVPEEDMPYGEDGISVDVMLNPLWVPSRMNYGQTFEVQLGLIAKTLGTTFAVPLFSNFTTNDIQDMLIKCDLPEDGKMKLLDGRTGEPFDNKVTVWYMHILKLSHMVEDKIHARAVGPYSLITQQPLGGKARDGWQRFWEMEVWALEGYSAVYTLQEMLTIKSDDVQGRNRTYDAIIKGNKLRISGIPESFNLVTYLFKWLCQNIQPLDQDSIDVIHKDRLTKITSLGLKGITSKQGIDDLELVDDTETKLEDKKEMIESVMQDMEEYWDVE
jgi:DNA-directed RNA polymerase subunit beta